jgi:hypothetical protein
VSSWQTVSYRACSVETNFLAIALYHTYLPASQLQGWSYTELNPNCLYADTKTKENPFHYFRFYVLNCLIRSLFIYFLIVRTCMVCDPSFLFERKKKIMFVAMLIWLALSCFEFVSVLRRRTAVWAWQRQRAITATTACCQDSQGKNASCVPSLSKTGASNII